MNDSYRKLRRLVSDLSFEDSFATTWAFSQYTQIKDFSFPSDVERHPSFTSAPFGQPYPWQLETILREIVLRSSDVHQRGKTLRRWNDVAAVVNALRALENALQADILGPDNILLEVLRVSHQQFPWQRPPATRFLGRYYWIFKDPKIDGICRELTGLPVQKIYAIGSGLWGHFISKPFLRLPIQLDDTTTLSSEEIAAFLTLCSSEVYSLRQMVKSEHVLDDAYAYDNRLVRTWPLVQFRVRGLDYLSCPLPTLLFWRYTSGLYYDLTANGDFFNALGASFQNYIGETLKRGLSGTELKYQAEEKYGRKGKTKDTIDWVILDADAAVFLECKSKRLSQNAKTKLVSREALNSDIAILADAIRQAYKTIAEYQADRYPSIRFDPARKIYPVIVTLENWFPLSGVVTTELNRQLKIKLVEANIPESVLTEMPYTVTSCEEIEEAVQIISSTGIQRFFEGKFTEQYQGWMLEGYMKQAFPTESAATVDLFAETFDEMLLPIMRRTP